MKILALDTATRSGYALFASGVTSSGVFDASIRTKATKTLEADHSGKRFYLFQRWLREAIRNSRPDLIVYERLVGGASSGGHTTMVQKGLEAIVHIEAFAGSENGPIPMWTFSPATIKKWATGNGTLTHESKILVTRMAFDKFSDQEWVQTAKGPDDNQADALWILDLAQAVAKVIVHETQDNYAPFVSHEDEKLTKWGNIVTAAKWSPAKQQ